MKIFFLSNIFFFYLIFFIVVYENLISMIPETLTITAFIKLPLMLSITFFGSSIIIAIQQKKFKFFQGFIPSGVPAPIAPILYIIEVISFLIRVFSLSIRLFINLLAGHILLKFIAIIMLLLVTSLSELLFFDVIISLLKDFSYFFRVTCLYFTSNYFSFINCYLFRSIFKFYSLSFAQYIFVWKYTFCSILFISILFVVCFCW